MSEDIKFEKWLNNSSEFKKEYFDKDIALLDFGFTDYGGVTGLAEVKKNLTLDEFKYAADEKFFESFRKNIPFKLKNQHNGKPEPELRDGSITCQIDGKKYIAQYIFSKKQLLFFDESTRILNPEDMIIES